MLTQKSKTEIEFTDASGDDTKIEALNNIGEVTIETLHNYECVLTVLDKAQALAVGLALIRWAQTGKLEAMGCEFFKVGLSSMSFDVRATCAKCGDEIYRAEGTDPGETVARMKQSIAGHTFGNAMIDGKPYCEKCAKESSP